MEAGLFELLGFLSANSVQTKHKHMHTHTVKYVMTVLFWPMVTLGHANNNYTHITTSTREKNKNKPTKSLLDTKVTVTNQGVSSLGSDNGDHKEEHFNHQYN